MAVQTSNNFGDQIIAVVDLSIDAKDKDKDAHFKYVAGKIIFKNIEYEGNWVEFTEKSISKLMGMKCEHALKSLRKLRKIVKTKPKRKSRK